MSILIRGMEMPTSCVDCPMMQDENGYCKLRKEYVYGDIPRSCPLVPVPPHGRLIDADALHIQLIDKELDQLQPWTSFDDYREVLQMIDDAPTIIESEVEDDSPSY